jgi:SAM-dependent methyltransferase
VTPAAAAKRAWRAFLRLLPARLTERIFQSWANVVATRGDARSALRELFAIEDHLQREIDHAAIRLDGGVHAKHRLTRYHDFFVERIRPGERVLDVGTGKGELAHDIALRAGALVTAIDVKRESLDFARQRFAHPRVRFLEHDAVRGLPSGPFEVVILSNVLEHVEPRVELLRRIVQELRPSRILIRVPSGDRHWHVPLRQELGLPWFSDPSHAVEYDRPRLIAELHGAGLEATDVQAHWGELWAEARAVTDE